MRFRLTRRAAGSLLLAAAGVLSIPFATGARAQSYPAKPITLVVPFAAGGPTDTIGRIVADHMSRTLAQQIVVENVAGAGGTTGAERAAKAAPDGYTLLIHHSGLGAAPSLYANLRYDARTAFEAVGLINSGPMVLVTKKDIEAKTLKELAEWMKANAAKITMAHAGVGSNAHVCGLLVQQVLGQKFTFAVYRGTGPAMNDLVGGQIDVMCDQSTNAVPQIAGGTIKAYAVLSTERLNSIKDVPTSTEAGLPDLQMVLYNGLYAPKGTPMEVISTLNAALLKAIQDPNVIEKFATVGTAPFAFDMRSPEAHGKFFLEDMDRQAQMFKAAGIQPGAN